MREGFLCGALPHTPSGGDSPEPPAMGFIHNAKIFLKPNIAGAGVRPLQNPKKIHNPELYLPHGVWYNFGMDKKRKNRIFNTVLYCVSAVLILGGVWMLLNELFIIGKQYEAPPTPTPTAAVVPTAVPTVLPTAAASPTATPLPTPTPKPEPPVCIWIPRFEIQCPIQPVGLADNDGDGVSEAIGTVDAPDIAAWYERSAIPGEEGNSIISGHVRYGGVLGHFSVLPDMQVGDSVIIQLADGELRYFTVESVTSYKAIPLDEPPYYDYDLPRDVLALDGRARITLMSCTGKYNSTYGTHDHRIAVVCVPAEPTA